VINKFHSYVTSRTYLPSHAILKSSSSRPKQFHFDRNNYISNWYSLDDSIGSVSIASPICNGTLLCIRVQVTNDAMIESWRLFGPPAAQQPSHDNSAPAVAAPPVTCEVDVQTGEIDLSCINYPLILWRDVHVWPFRIMIRTSHEHYLSNIRMYVISVILTYFSTAFKHNYSSQYQRPLPYSQPSVDCPIFIFPIKSYVYPQMGWWKRWRFLFRIKGM